MAWKKGRKLPIKRRTASLPAHVDIWSCFFPSRHETRRLSLFFVLFKVKTAIASGSGHRREPQVFKFPSISRPFVKPVIRVQVNMMTVRMMMVAVAPVRTRTVTVVSSAGGFFFFYLFLLLFKNKMKIKGDFLPIGSQAHATPRS